MKPRRETDVGQPVSEWLRDMGWRVYPEVEVPKATGIADMVATRGPLVWIIECKVSLSLDLLGQIIQWEGFAHMRSIAIPRLRTAARTAAQRLLHHEGIGMIHAGASSLDVYEALSPRLARHAPSVARVRSALCDEHEGWATPGQASSAGSRLTAFSLTCRRVRDFATNHPGCSMKSLVESVEHHYHSSATARSALATWIRKGIVPGVRAERDGRALRIYADAAP